jgi:ABC-type transporter MlaC component
MRRIACRSLFAVSLAVLLTAGTGLAVRAQDTAAPTDKTTPKPAKPAASATAKPAQSAVKATAKVTVKKPDPTHPAGKVAVHPAKPKPTEKKLAAKPKISAPPVKAVTSTEKAQTASYTITTIRNGVTTTRTVAVPETGSTAAKTAPLSDAPTPALPPAKTAAAPANPPAAGGPARAVALPTVVVAAPDPKQAGRAAGFVASFLTEAFRIARAPGATPLQRRAQLADLFGAKMDVSRMAVSTTANVLNTTSADFQRRFRTILISYLVETYYPRLELASDPSVRVDSKAAAALPDGTEIVWTTFTKPGWGEQTVKWQLAAAADGFRIVDIYSSGASLVQMERDTFVSVMRDGGLPELMAKLDARTKALASAAP